MLFSKNNTFLCILYLNKKNLVNMFFHVWYGTNNLSMKVFMIDDTNFIMKIINDYLECFLQATAAPRYEITCLRDFFHFN